eukprot:CAMPEP_0117801144 /NCGR_PEP_ID=MMETSP0948-20121206/14899_1 /TAXON_ID=44440 /ORGANISM="Chattonella subsalsa, Strain CCMP2191" /LENGTH=205 /DNA_ID=CAMNT_0005633575 /DNA_START=63 /DNA_END=680 /DNA_ORIENTATION=+
MKKLSFHTKPLFISILYAALTSTDGVTICGGNGSSPDGCGVVNSAGLGFSIFLGITLPFIVIAAYLWIKQIRAGDQCSLALPRFGPESSRREPGPHVEVVRALEVPELPRGTSLSSQMQLPESSNREEASQRADENPFANFISGIFQPKSKRDDLQQEAQLFEVIVPEGVSPGQEFQVMAGGKLMTVVCPMNAGAGSPIRIKPPE